MTLVDRCTKVLADFEAIKIKHRPSQERWEKLIDHLKNFVLSEIGRAADKSLEDCAPLVLYFADEAGREEFMAIVMEEKPNWIRKRWPE